VPLNAGLRTQPTRQNTSWVHANVANQDVAKDRDRGARRRVRCALRVSNHRHCLSDGERHGDDDEPVVLSDVNGVLVTFAQSGSLPGRGPVAPRQAIYVRRRPPDCYGARGKSCPGGAAGTSAAPQGAREPVTVGGNWQPTESPRGSRRATVRVTAVDAIAAVDLAGGRDVLVQVKQVVRVIRAFHPGEAFEVATVVVVHAALVVVGHEVDVPAGF
jgi:hypothetical protein